MRARIVRLAAFASLLAAPSFAAAAPPSPQDGRGWLGEELPLPLAVRTAQDLAVKAAAEKQYLIFNLLAGGKLAWDGGDYATAATKWEALLRVHARAAAPAAPCRLSRRPCPSRRRRPHPPNRPRVRRRRARPSVEPSRAAAATVRAARSSG